MEMKGRVSVSVLAQYLKKVIPPQDLLPPIGRRINCQREFWSMEVFAGGGRLLILTAYGGRV